MSLDDGRKWYSPRARVRVPCKGCGAMIENRGTTGMCRSCYSGDKKPSNCVGCGDKISRKSTTGCCKTCANKARSIGDQHCKGCNAKITRHSKGGYCFACSHKARSVTWSSQPSDRPIKPCPIGRHGFPPLVWAESQISDRGIERVMLAAMDRAGVRHA